MNREQFAVLQTLEQEYRLISIDDLEDKSPRTLLWGYTCNRESWHVYIEDNNIHLYCYGDGYFPKDHFNCYRKGDFPPEDLVPNKRLYPEACDFEFCKLLRLMGVHLPFTNWQDNRPYQQYYGETK